MRDYTLCLNPDNNKINLLMLIDTITGRIRLHLVKLGYFFDGFKGIKIIFYLKTNSIGSFQMIKKFSGFFSVLKIDVDFACSAVPVLGKVRQARYGLNLILNLMKRRSHMYFKSV